LGLKEIIDSLDIDVLVVTPLERSLLTLQTIFKTELASNTFNKRIILLPFLIEVGNNSCDIPLELDTK